jgi:hypothetical protein
MAEYSGCTSSKSCEKNFTSFDVCEFFKWFYFYSPPVGAFDWSEAPVLLHKTDFFIVHIHYIP